MKIISNMYPKSIKSKTWNFISVLNIWLTKRQLHSDTDFYISTMLSCLVNEEENLASDSKARRQCFR